MGKKDEQRDFGFRLDEEEKKTLITAAAIAAGGLVLWGICHVLGLGDMGGMPMKAPGKKGQYIRRDVFESNPKDYFDGLRRKG